MTPTTLAVLLVTLVIGAVLMCLGWRGRRIDRAPICRGCRFDLTGVLPEGRTCPECGAGLARPNAVRVGRRRRLWPVAAFGLMLAGAPLSLLGMAGYAVLTGDSLTQFMPVGVLLAQAKHGSPNAIVDAGAELVARHKAGKLSDAQRQKIIGTILDIQGDPAALWDEVLGDFIEVGRIDGAVDDRQYQRFLNQAVVFEFATRPVIGVGDPVPVSVRKQQDRVGTGSTIVVHIAIEDLRNGVSTLDQWRDVHPAGDGTISRVMHAPGYNFSAWGSASGVSSGNSTQYFSRLPNPALALGPQELTIDFNLEGQLYVMGRPQVMREGSDSCLRASTRLGFEVVPEDQRELTRIPASEEMNTRLIREVGLQANIYERRSLGPGGVMLTFDFSHLPVPLAHGVFVVLGDSELPVGSVQQTAADQTQPAAPRRWGIETHLGPGVLPDDARSLTVILRPNPALALDRPDLQAIYEGELVFRGVQIERR